MTAFLMPMLLVSLVLGAAGVWAVRRLERGATIPEGGPPRAAWGWPEALLALVLPVLFGVLLYAPFLREGKAEEHLVAALTVQAVAAALGAAAAILVASRSSAFRREQLGITLRGAPRFFALGLAAWFAFLPAYAVANLLNAALHEMLGLPVELQMPVEGLAREGDPAALGAILLLVTIWIPVAEEITFRGIVYGALRRYLGRAAGMIGSAVLFALLHDRSALVPILAVGLLLAWIYERTGSIVAPIAAHMLHNGVVVATVRAFPGAVEGTESEAVATALPRACEGIGRIAQELVPLGSLLMDPVSGRGLERVMDSLPWLARVLF
jgi:membrane protease YdiL (CAAX protease family)